MAELSASEKGWSPLKMAEHGVESTHGMPYGYGPSAQTLYATSGSASDWVYDVVGCKYSFSIELRDRGVFGFLLPRTEIIPTAEETWAGIQAVVSHLHQKYSVRVTEVAGTTVASDEVDDVHSANATTFQPSS